VSKSKSDRNRSEFQTPPKAIGQGDCLRVVLTRSAPNARPIGPYSTGLWVHRRSIGAEGEERKRVGRRCRCRKGCRSQGEHNHPLPPYQLTPSSPPIMLQQHGVLWHHRTPHSQPVAWIHPKPSHNGLVLGFFWPPPCAGSNGHAHHHHHLAHTTPPPPTIALDRHLTGHTRNRAGELGFRVFFGPSLSPSRALERAPTTTTSTSSTSPYHLPPSPYTTV
jgi:hypothetical protein